MWELDHKEGWVLKNSNCGGGEDSWESLDSKEITPVHPKGNQLWIFIGRTDVEAEAPILWPLHAKSWLIGKDPDAGKDWGQEEKGASADKIWGIIDSTDISLSKLQEIVKDRWVWYAAVHVVTKSRTWLSDEQQQGKWDRVLSRPGAGNLSGWAALGKTSYLPELRLLLCKTHPVTGCPS